MAVCILTRASSANGAPMFYRVEIALNLFGEWSVLFNWGQSGHFGQYRAALFNDLRAASLAADVARERMLNRGYRRAL